MSAYTDEVDWTWEILAACEPVSWGRAGAPAHAARAPLEAGPQALLEVDVGRSGLPTAQQQLRDFFGAKFWSLLPTVCLSRLWDLDAEA